MKRNFLKTQFLILSLFLASMAYGQFTVTGKVSDEKGESLIGATLLVKGTAVGTITDIDGSYSVTVPGQSGILQISYTGYEPVELQVRPGMGSQNVVLMISKTLLDEVVVVGYGSSNRAGLTGSVTSLRSEKLEQRPLASVQQSLQGNVAGLQATTASGQPGANVQIRIRGIGSISASSEPLYVIDGIPATTGDLTRVNTTANTMVGFNPNDIESVTVLKDASATSIYGSRGANGVILITTKSGKAGKAKIDLKTQVGYNNWAVSEDRQLRSLTAAEYIDMFFEGYRNAGQTTAQIITRYNGWFPNTATFDATSGAVQEILVDTDWLKGISRTGFNQSYDLSVSGGNDLITYYASGAYFKQESPIIYSGLDRYSSRLNLRVNPSDKLKISNNISVSKLNQRGMSDGSGWANPMYNALFLAPVIPVKDSQGRYYGDHQTFFMGGNNPIGSLSGDDERYFDQIRIMDNLWGEYSILKNLKFKSAWSFDMINVQEFFYRNMRYGDGRNIGGNGFESVINDFNWIGTQTLNYDVNFGDKHGITVLAGYEAQEARRKRVYAVGQGYPNPNLRTLASIATPTTSSSDLSQYRFVSMFTRLDYNYAYKYYFSGSLRRDGSSRFGVNNRFGNFWSAGLSWRIDQEGFIEGLDFIDALKLRASIGTTGNAGIGNYDHIPLFGFGNNYGGEPGGAPSNIGNLDLTWESTTSMNIGLDFGLFRFLNGTVEYFDRESKNLLLNRPISSTTGFLTLSQNFGSMRNKGFEITVNADIISGKDLSWSLGGNITFLKNEVTKLPEDIIDGTKLRRQGLDFQTWYMFEYAGVDPANGLPLFYKDSSMTEKTSKFTEAKRFYVDGRSATPDFFGGLNTALSYKGFSVDAHFVYSYGNYVFDTEGRFLQGDGALPPRSQTNLVLNRWKKPGDITDVPMFRWGNTSQSNAANLTRWLFDASYLRLRNLTVSYTLPTELVSKATLRSARVYFGGTNLLTFFKDDKLYYDPEAGVNGLIESPVPNMKTFTIGLDLGF